MPHEILTTNAMRLRRDWNAGIVECWNSLWEGETRMSESPNPARRDGFAPPRPDCSFSGAKRRWGEVLRTSRTRNGTRDESRAVFRPCAEHGGRKSRFGPLGRWHAGKWCKRCSERPMGAHIRGEAALQNRDAPNRSIRITITIRIRIVLHHNRTCAKPRCSHHNPRLKTYLMRPV